MFPFVRYKILLSLPGLVLVLYSMLFPYLLLFLGEKTMFSFQTLLKGTFSHLTCHLFSITVRVSMTLKRQWVQSLSDHKTGRTFCVSQERWIVEGMVWSKTNGRSVLSGATKGGGGGEGEEVVVKGGKWVRLGRETKNTSKTTIETDKEKNKERKQKRKRKWQFRSLNAVEKLVNCQIRSRWSITKRQKCSTLKSNIYHKKLEINGMHVVTRPVNRPFI